MLNYLIRRLLLLPITLFCILLVNFVILNMAPGDPVTFSEASQDGSVRRQDQSIAFGADDRYFQFREFYGMTLPILFNDWPSISQEEVNSSLWSLVHRQWSPENPEQMDVKAYDSLRMTFGDQSRFVMSKLLAVIENPLTDNQTLMMASRFFARGGTRLAYLGADLTDEEQAYNQKVAVDNKDLLSWVIISTDTEDTRAAKIKHMRAWYEANTTTYHFNPEGTEKVSIFFFETRISRYLSRVMTLDFGTMRNDRNKTVISEVTKRFKYSLTLSLIPMLITFVLCQVFGFLMAYYQGRWPDFSLNVVFLVLYAIPVFVVAPFLIEKIAMHFNFPFTNMPIPISGFTSPDSIYEHETTWQRLGDILRHIALPLVAVTYGSLAAQARLSRTAVLEVLGQDYVRTAKAKGLGPFTILFKHVGRNASITIVTSIAGSLGIVLGGSLIVETLFNINGFGKFFYDAVINRDYNVIMFSALASSFLTLAGYLAADIAYTVLDPRLTLE